MVFESTYPKTVSSGPDGKRGLNDAEEEPWSPREDDDEPSVTVSVNSDDGEEDFIDSVKISGLENVDKVTVTVVDSDGDPVNICFLAE